MNLRDRDHKPRKRFGQNFLHDQNIIRRIVSCIAPKAGESIMEIGPGQGALTRPLLDMGAQVTAVEIDRDLASSLRLQFSAFPAFRLIEGDALALDLKAIDAQVLPVRVVGNLPYNISTPLLFHLLSQREDIRDMHFMLQKEVVDRIAAVPGNRDYGRLSVMMQYFCDVVHAFDVPPAAFYPAPKVMSAIVRLIPRPPLERAADEGLMAAVVNAAFSQRRKTLRNTLRPLMVEQQIASAGIDSAVRAETLSVADFVRLSNVLADKQQDRNRGDD